MQRAHLNLSAISSDLACQVKQLCVIEPISNGRQVWEGVSELQYVDNPLAPVQTEEKKKKHDDNCGDCVSHKLRYSEHRGRAEQSSHWNDVPVMCSLDVLELDNNVVTANSVLQGDYVVIGHVHSNKDIATCQRAVLLGEASSCRCAYGQVQLNNTKIAMCSMQRSE
eukprot:13607-Heterococcus_DN1.PRE.2